MYNKPYDVIVIGSGSIGTPAAFYFVQSGLNTLVIDSNESSGQSSNKTAIGGIRATHSDFAKIYLCQQSIDVFSTWKELFGDDIGWFKGGYCFVAYRELEKNKIIDLIKVQKSYGLNIEWLDRDDILKCIPKLNPDHLIGGSYSPDDGSASPLLACHSFFIHAKNLGAKFLFSEKVTEIIEKNCQVVGVKTNNNNTYYSKIVLNAAGAWARDVANLANVEIRVSPDSHEAAVTDPLPRFLIPLIVDLRSTVDSANFYFYQNTSGHIIMCITPNPNIWGFQSSSTSQFLPIAANRLIKLFPHLKSLKIRRTWRGLYPMTPDGFPIVGQVKEKPGFVLAVGMCGQGFMLGPGLGKLLTRLIKDELTALDQQILNRLSPERSFDSQEALQ